MCDKQERHPVDAFTNAPKKLAVFNSKKTAFKIRVLNFHKRDNISLMFGKYFGLAAKFL